MAQISFHGAGPSGICFAFHGAGIPTSSIGERKGANIGKATLNVLICQGKQHPLTREGRGQRTVIRGQKTDDGGQRTEGIRQENAAF